MVTATDLKADNSEARATLVALEAQKKDIRNRWLLSLPALFIIFFAASYLSPCYIFYSLVSF